jgi:hypothetical protein
VSLDAGFSTAVNQLYIVVATWNGATFALYVNGSSKASASIASWPTIGYGSQVASIAAAGAHTDNPCLGQLVATGVCPYALTAEQIAEFSANMWQVCRQNSVHVILGGLAPPMARVSRIMAVLPPPIDDCFVNFSHGATTRIAPPQHNPIRRVRVIIPDDSRILEEN